jgi:signal transduction histidine kinase
LKKGKNLFSSIDGYFKNQSKTFLFIGNVIIIFSIGIADYLTGQEISFSIFYLLPISLSVWYTNRNITISMCIISSIVEFVANYAAGKIYSHYLISFWNSTVLLIFFLLYSFILSRLQKEYASRIKLIDDLQDSLIELSRTKEELGQKSQDLARSNVDLQQFAYAASHDLQAPLRGVAGFVNLFARRYRGKLDEKADEFIEIIIDGIKRMEILIKDLLEYSQVGTRGIQLKPMDSELAVAQALTNLKAEIEEKNAVITYDTLPKVIADSSQLSRLFQNLIGNAVKFCREKLPKVHISAERKGHQWLFSVHDNGIGIDPYNQDRIFVIFQRLHTGAEYEGTGIGLAICKRIVERHGGSIWVESEPGKGSTFYFTIPERRDPI